MERPCLWIGMWQVLSHRSLSSWKMKNTENFVLNTMGNRKSVFFAKRFENLWKHDNLSFNYTIQVYSQWSFQKLEAQKYEQFGSEHNVATIAWSTANLFFSAKRFENIWKHDNESINHNNESSKSLNRHIWYKFGHIDAFKSFVEKKYGKFAFVFQIQQLLILCTAFCLFELFLLHCFPFHMYSWNVDTRR